ncbi:hypothetical protein TWF694_005370 [Orbilia ellipsospora]|uniref:Uncharacterized protein n=1 Tax=Orbilia ellipsospora TaxID=2528407 RepID=A0AAV9WSV9_9PEZI
MAARNGNEYGEEWLDATVEDRYTRKDEEYQSENESDAGSSRVASHVSTIIDTSSASTINLPDPAIAISVTAPCDNAGYPNTPGTRIT